MEESLKKYILNILHISPKSLINKKDRIIKSEYIIRALDKDECFYPGVEKLRKIIFGVLERDEESIITFLSLDLCLAPKGKEEGMQSTLIKAIICEHFC